MSQAAYQKKIIVPLLVIIVCIFILTGVLCFRYGEAKARNNQQVAISPTVETFPKAVFTGAPTYGPYDIMPMQSKQELPAIFSAVMQDVVANHADLYNQPVLSISNYDTRMAKGNIWDIKRFGYGTDEWIAAKLQGKWTVLRFQGKGASCDEASSLGVRADDLRGYLYCQ